jgi:hypothetical protein
MNAVVARPSTESMISETPENNEGTHPLPRGGAIDDVEEEWI